MPRVLDIESRSEREQLEGGRRRESVDCRLNCTYTRIACSITWASASWTWNTCFNCINIHHYTSLYIFVHHVASLFISTLCSFFVVMQDVSRRYRIRPVNSQHPLFWLFCNNGTKLWDIFLIIKHTHPILLNCQTEQQTQTKHYDGQNALLQCFSTVGPPSTVRHQQGDLASQLWHGFISVRFQDLRHFLSLLCLPFILRDRDPARSRPDGCGGVCCVRIMAPGDRNRRVSGPTERCERWVDWLGEDGTTRPGHNVQW